MNAPVDVLAVLREMRRLVPSISHFDPTLCLNPLADKADAAIAAVTELIEADKAYDLAQGALEEHYRQMVEKGFVVAKLFNVRELQEVFVRAEDRRLHALLRVAPCNGGAS